jgi:hypothetical protein
MNRGHLNRRIESAHGSVDNMDKCSIEARLQDSPGVRLRDCLWCERDSHTHTAVAVAVGDPDHFQCGPCACYSLPVVPETFSAAPGSAWL